MQAYIVLRTPAFILDIQYIYDTLKVTYFLTQTTHGTAKIEKELGA
jgi:hypothetical protein